MITLNWICIYLNISLYAPSGKRNVCTCDDCQGRTGHARAGKRSSRQGCLPDCCTKGLLRSFICKWKPNAHADKQDERTSDDTHTHSRTLAHTCTHKEQKKQWKITWQPQFGKHTPNRLAHTSSRARQRQQQQPDNVWQKDYGGHLYIPG